MNIQAENWRSLPGWEGLYEVSDLGRIKNTKTQRLLNGYKDHKGYVRVNLPAPDTKRKQQNRLLHQLVLEAFVGPRPEGMVSLHGAKGVSDNSVSNLSWGTQYQNIQDRKRDNTNNNPRPKAKGEGNHQAKLTEDKVILILKAKGVLPQWRLAKAFDVHPALISAIHRGVKWGHVHV